MNDVWSQMSEIILGRECWPQGLPASGAGCWEGLWVGTLLGGVEHERGSWFGAWGMSLPHIPLGWDDALDPGHDFSHVSVLPWDR